MSVFLVGFLKGHALAFSEFKHPTKEGLKCNTACHQAENIIKARKDKQGKQECKGCHIGLISQKPFTPFLPVSFKSIDKPPTVRNPDTQLASTEAVSPASEKKEESTEETEKKPVPSIPGMAYVPAGEFIMGSNERWHDEAPEYLESTKAFFIDLYEITNEDYAKFAKATERETPYHWPNGNIPKGKGKHPVVYVNWFDAHDYCAWAGKRLPTEEEWEKASRGNDGLIYPWGNEWTQDKSNNPYKGSTGTEPVGSYPQGRSPYGLYDMSGNVWEWVNAYYLPHPGNTVPSPEYGKDKRVLKGGSWFDCLSYGCGLSAPTFNRSFFTPEVRNNSFGFRCAKSP